MSYTTFANEEVLLKMPDNEVLVLADTAQGRTYVAVTSDGYRTDYPLFYPHNGSIAWDNPEWFSDRFKTLVAKLIAIWEA